jgi:hypothetical protein
VGPIRRDKCFNLTKISTCSDITSIELSTGKIFSIKSTRKTNSVHVQHTRLNEYVFQHPRCVSCNEFVRTSMEAPLKGLLKTVGRRIYVCESFFYKKRFRQKYLIWIKQLLF